jgi:hypothetical protein
VSVAAGVGRRGVVVVDIENPVAVKPRPRGVVGAGVKGSVAADVWRRGVVVADIEAPVAIDFGPSLYTA